MLLEYVKSPFLKSKISQNLDFFGTYYATPKGFQQHRTPLGFQRYFTFKVACIHHLYARLFTEFAWEMIKNEISHISKKEQPYSRMAVKSSISKKRKFKSNGTLFPKSG